ncbi:uncharacterized protein LOC126973397 [Leptidea sinapis]|uniref:uncharacterized protein LOC126973397 n=1 Tax=Leptidea sinapis TaxID=189913 RepID=UPI0021240B80|nr:uncharacterized protein LOC126973397 [Leptidea sinapis]
MNFNSEVVDITSDGEEEEQRQSIAGTNEPEKPIISLFRRLIDNERAVFTNEQILHLLNIEFNINVKNLQPVEIDIYISVMKRFLKDWPQWDTFDRAINEYKKENNQNAIEMLLNSKYEDFKSYLKPIVDTTTQMATKPVEDDVNITNLDDNKEKHSDVTLVIEANRSQLNNLVLRHPKNSMLFNGNKQEKTIKSYILPLDAILNWWNVQIQVRVKVKHDMILYYSRETKHKLKHTLVNKVLGVQSPSPKESSLQLQIKSDRRHKKTVHTNVVTKKLKRIASMLGQPDAGESSRIIDFIVNEIGFEEKLAVPAYYKRTLSQYAYKRYLYVDNADSDAVDKKYDVQLEEIITPTIEMFVGDCDLGGMTSSEVNVKCIMCDVTFTGRHIIQLLNDHFQEHASEKPWTCLKCGVELPMIELADSWWCHFPC